MTNEIKEIISYLKKKENTRRIKCITTEETTQLLDYITNLQEEITGLDTALDSGVKNIKEKQQRIDKAKEYIENNFLYHYGSYEKPIVFEDNYIQDLYDILRGNDNER